MPARDPSSASFVRRFLHDEAAGGVVLLAATAVALGWANFGGYEAYESFWHGGLDLGHWVNEGLMAVFFFVVGLEVTREVTEGELRQWRTAALPVVAAVGGMVVPAALYLALAGGGEAGRGWGIPMATDIAFAVGVLALVGRRAPSGLKLFLLTLAVVDDIGAVVVIAVFYSHGVNAAPLAGAVLLLGAMALMARRGVRHPVPYTVFGVAVWAAFYESGVHATLAGVAVALVVPATRRVEELLHPWVAFAVVPLFALANAGVRVSLGDGLGGPVSTAVAAGLVVGKPVGIGAASYAAVRSGLATLPAGVRRPHLLSVGALAGIGFTVSLFVAGLAFETGDLVDEAKVGILAGSLVSAVVGALGLTFWRPKN